MPSPIAAAFASTLETKGAASLKKYSDQAAKATSHHIKMGEAAKKAAAATGRAAGTLDQFREAARTAAVDFYIGKSAIEGLGSHIAGTLTLGANIIKSMADPLVNLTKLANPGAVLMFERAFADAMAVMGRVALPVVQAFTRALGTVGNYYAQLEPILLSVSNTIADSIDKVFGDLKKMWDEMGPAAELLASALSFVIKGATNLVRALIHVATLFSRIYNTVARFLGFKGTNFNKGASSFGAAVRQVDITRSGEEFSNANQKKALEQALTTGPKKAEVPDLLDSIWKTLQENLKGILAAMANLPTKDDVKEAINGIVNALTPDSAGPGSAAKGAIGSMGGNALGKLAGLLSSAMTR